MSQSIETYFPVVIQKKRNPKPYRRLGVRQQRVLALFMSGHSKQEISKAMGMSSAAVSLIINNPSSMDLLERASRDNELEIKAMLPLAISAMRTAMRSDEEETALRAAKAYFQVTGRAKDKDADATTAEDVVARILEITSTGPVTIRMAEKTTTTRAHMMLPDREDDLG